MTFEKNPLVSSFFIHPSHEKLQQIKRAYAIIGQRGAGKTTALSYLKEYPSVYTVPSSAALKNYLTLKYNRPPTITDLIHEGQSLKEMHGHGVLIHMSLADLFNTQSSNIDTFIIDGLRTSDELNAFRQIFPKIGKIIYINAPFKTLWERIQKRQHETGEIRYHSQADFQKTQALEQARIESLQKLADYTIHNNGDLHSFRQQITNLIKLPQ